MEDEKNLLGLEALHFLKSSEPTLYLTPSQDLSKAARLASEYVFTSLRPFAPKSTLPRLYTECFDGEQIWQQIDLQGRPLLAKLRQQVKNLQMNGDEVVKQFTVEPTNQREEYANAATNDFLDDDDEEDADEDHESEGEMEGELGNEEKEEEDDDGEEEDDDEIDREDDRHHERARQGENVVEDEFLKIKELEEYLLEDEAREFGQQRKRSREKLGKEAEDDNSDDELGLMMGLDDDDDNDEMENARYEDFFGNERSTNRKKSRSSSGKDKMDTDDHCDDGTIDQKGEALSTHDKEQQKLKSEIEKWERANLEPKPWTMQGEVTAAKRPKNSALEADIDFDHNSRSAPVITEEVTASLEDLIKNRIVEGLFDDIEKRPSMSMKAPREKIELDESKSKKGLAELYEEEYAQKTGLVSNAHSFNDEQKKEASLLFKKLCLKLDALSHFYFTPRPVIEDMSIQANVPALAIEEVAPLAVSDAAMLAPEEIFSSKGEIKEEAELTKADRKRRRAKKKRTKAEAAKRMIIRPKLDTPTQ